MSMASNGLPPGWVEATLGEVARPSRPRAAPTEHPKDPFIGMEHVEAHSMKLLGSVPAGSMKSSAVRFEAGDVLYGRLRPYLNKVYRPDFRGLCSAEFIVFPDCPPLDARFLQYRLNAADFMRFASSLNAGDRPRVDFDQLAPFPFRVPPLPEQRRIVAEIEAQFSRLDAGVAALRRVAANLKRYKAAVLKAACDGSLTADWRAAHPDAEPAGGLLRRILAERRRRWEQAELAKMVAKGKPPKDDRWKARYEEPESPKIAGLPALPKTWTWATAAQLTPFDRPAAYGVLQPGENRDDGVEFVRVCDIMEGSVLRDQLKRIDPKIAAAYPRTRLQGGEVLVTIVGTIGRSAVAPADLAGANTARAVGVIPVTMPIDPRYVEICFRNPAKARELVGKSHEVARKTLNLEDVRATCIPLPPLDEQSVIVDTVEDAWSIIRAVESAVQSNWRRAGHLRQSMLRDAFAGKLVPQDPTDEPAAALLERIRAERSMVAAVGRPARKFRASAGRTEKPAPSAKRRVAAGGGHS